MRSSIVVLILALGAVSSARADEARGDKTVFGIEIDAPLNLPTCPKNIVLAKHPFCKIVDQVISPRKMDTGATGFEVAFATDQQPSWVHGGGGVGDLFVSVLGGKVVEVQFGTYGYKVQERALATLRAKYGKEDSLTDKEMRNPLAGHFTAFEASWVLAGLVVHFDSVSDSIDWGDVRITTPQYMSLINAQSEKKRAAEPKL
jgi:hypothetical protein